MCIEATPLKQPLFWVKCCTIGRAIVQRTSWVFEDPQVNLKEVSLTCLGV